MPDPFFSGFDEIWIFSTDFPESSQYETAGGTRPLGALLIDGNRGTDMNEANKRFLRLGERF
jgi:hypothetical protein